MTARDSWDDPDNDAVTRRSGRATATDRRRLRSVAASGDQAMQDAYESGRREAKAEARAKAQHKSTKRKPTSSPTRRATKRVREPLSSGAARAVRQVQAPVADQVAGSVRITILALGVVALYSFLNSANNVAGVLGSFSKGLTWLQASDRSIPYVSKG